MMKAKDEVCGGLTLFVCCCIVFFAMYLTTVITFDTLYLCGVSVFVAIVGRLVYPLVTHNTFPRGQKKRYIQFCAGCISVIAVIVVLLLTTPHIELELVMTALCIAYMICSAVLICVYVVRNLQNG